MVIQLRNPKAYEVRVGDRLYNIADDTFLDILSINATEIHYVYIFHEHGDIITKHINILEGYILIRSIDA